MSTSRKVDNLRSEPIAGLNSCFAIVTEQKIKQMLAFSEYVVLSPSLDMLIQLFSSILASNGF